MDIDKDGYIDKFDLDTFLHRYHFIKEIRINYPPKPNSLHTMETPSVTIRSSSNNYIGSEGNELYPNVEIEDKKLVNILRQVKQSL